MHNWEPELAVIVNSYYQKIHTSPDRIREHTKEAVSRSVDLLQRKLCLNFSKEIIPEIMEFLDKSIVAMNSLMPDSEPDRLAILIPLNPPRIEIRLIKKEYTLNGHLAVIADHCPKEEAGECLAIVYLAKFPKSCTN